MTLPIETLKAKRGNAKASLTRIKTFLNNNPNPLIEELECRLTLLDAYFKQILSIQDQIVEHKDATEADRGQISEIEDTYCQLKSQILQAMGAAKKKELSEFSFDQSTLTTAETKPTITESSCCSHSHLPKMKLPQFSGNYIEYTVFIKAFKLAVDRGTTLTKLEKFLFLRSAVSGEALKTIESLEVTADNYNTALLLLEQRYGNKYILFQTHICELFDIPHSNHASSQSLHSIVDTINVHINSLKSIGSIDEILSGILIHLAKNKLDVTTFNKWEESLDYQKLPTWDDFSQFINIRCRCLSSQRSSNRSEVPAPVKRDRHSKVALLASPTTCALCQSKEHRIHNCPDFLQKLVLERFHTVKRLGLCVNCLSKGHTVKTCRSSQCRICSSPHHSSLHRYAAPLSLPEPLPENNQINKLPSNSNQINSASLHSVSKPSQFNQVILATAIVYIKDNSGQFVPVRALLDSASQLNFVTESLSQKLQLKRNRINAEINGIGSLSSKVKFSTSMFLKSRTTEFSTELNALILPHITGLQPEMRIDHSNWGMSSNLNLADPKFFLPQKIEVLLGAEIFYQLLCVGRIQLKDDLPILQETLLGWIVAGGLKSSGHYKKLCNLVVEESNTHSVSDINFSKQLEQFWNIEEILSPNKHWTREEKECSSTDLTPSLIGLYDSLNGSLNASHGIVEEDEKEASTVEIEETLDERNIDLVPCTLTINSVSHTVVNKHRHFRVLSPNVQRLISHSNSSLIDKTDHGIVQCNNHPTVINSCQSTNNGRIMKRSIVKQKFSHIPLSRNTCKLTQSGNELVDTFDVSTRSSNESLDCVPSEEIISNSAPDNDKTPTNSFSDNFRFENSREEHIINSIDAKFAKLIKDACQLHKTKTSLGLNISPKGNRKNSLILPDRARLKHRPLSSSSICSTSSSSSSGSENLMGKLGTSYLASVESLAYQSENELIDSSSSLTVFEHACLEIVNSEGNYVEDLGQVIRGYLEDWRERACLKVDELKVLFSNIEEIYEFNLILLKQLINSGMDPVKIAKCFIDLRDNFDVYTTYCTSYPEAISLLTSLLQTLHTNALLTSTQKMLQHTLPLGSYLLKPVQRILKYHLLLDNLRKHCDTEEVVQAHEIMKEVARNIDQVKKKLEQQSRVKELSGILDGWLGPELTVLSELRQEGRLMENNKPRMVFLFQTMLIITKPKEDNRLQLKSYIYRNNLMLREHLPGEPTSFNVIPYDEPRNQIKLTAKNRDQKRLWAQNIKGVILEQFNTPPDKTIWKWGLNSSTPVYLERRNQYRRSEMRNRSKIKRKTITNSASLDAFTERRKLENHQLSRNRSIDDNMIPSLPKFSEDNFNDSQNFKQNECNHQDSTCNCSLTETESHKEISRRTMKERSKSVPRISHSFNGESDDEEHENSASKVKDSNAFHKFSTLRKSKSSKAVDIKNVQHQNYTNIGRLKSSLGYLQGGRHVK